MPAKRELTMRQIRQMLRLHRDGASAREIGRTLGVARSTVQDNLRRAAAAGLERQDSNRRMAIFDPFAIMDTRKSRRMSKNVIQIGLAFTVSQSGTVLASRAFETLRDPALPA